MIPRLAVPGLGPRILWGLRRAGSRRAVVLRALREAPFESFHWLDRLAFCSYLRARGHWFSAFLCDFVKDHLEDVIADVSTVVSAAERVDVVFLGDVVARCVTSEDRRLAWELLYQCSQHHRETSSQHHRNHGDETGQVGEAGQISETAPVEYVLACKEEMVDPPAPKKRKLGG